MVQSMLVYLLVYYMWETNLLPGRMLSRSVVHDEDPHTAVKGVRGIQGQLLQEWAQGSQQVAGVVSPGNGGNANHQPILSCSPVENLYMILSQRSFGLVFCFEVERWFSFTYLLSNPVVFEVRYMSGCSSGREFSVPTLVEVCMRI